MTTPRLAAHAHLRGWWDRVASRRASPEDRHFPASPLGRWLPDFPRNPALSRQKRSVGPPPPPTCA